MTNPLLERAVLITSALVATAAVAVAAYFLGRLDGFAAAFAVCREALK